MNKLFEQMSYTEFKGWCEQRACDGQWSLDQAITCISILDEIEGIKVKGFFKKKATKQARELAWKNLYQNNNLINNMKLM